ncbi:molybdopterin converting factor subunit 1 [Gracilibacillus dipsosauri]|uniref:Molybdopterin synthase sulfur carrier subunit n=2 Tax=Gracilibacillus TaxID=74385 RepID=A0A317L007_9BACI|nr:molybdopterin converting factor subunit 1 [Gracilibacillus dipsosauri]PWU68148.1 molybdopterin converting factor subunit 1 [Gracilibacillus dipsosauri]
MIEILLFAQLQEDAGTDKLLIDGDGWTVKKLKNQLITQYQLLQVEQSMVAINEAYALDSDEIHSGDIVAIIPPVSGG